MISEGSCDTEDWSNDAENSALITGINYTLLYIIFYNITILTIFDQTNAAFQKQIILQT